MDYSNPDNFVPVKSTNAIWEHFTRSKDGLKAKCLVPSCEAILSCKGGCTGAIRGHLSVKHQITAELKIKPSTSTSQETPRITKFFKPDNAPLHQVVAELAAVDMMSFSVIAKSKRMRLAFESQGFKIPRKHQAVRQVITF